MTGGKLNVSEDQQELLSPLAGLAFPIRDGVPVLRFDQARELDELEDVK